MEQTSGRKIKIRPFVLIPGIIFFALLLFPILMFCGVICIIDEIEKWSIKND